MENSIRTGEELRRFACESRAKSLQELEHSIVERERALSEREYALEARERRVAEREASWAKCTVDIAVGGVVPSNGAEKAFDVSTTRGLVNSSRRKAGSKSATILTTEPESTARLPKVESCKRVLRGSRIVGPGIARLAVKLEDCELASLDPSRLHNLLPLPDFIPSASPLYNLNVSFRNRKRDRGQQEPSEMLYQCPERGCTKLKSSVKEIAVHLHDRHPDGVVLKKHFQAIDESKCEFKYSYDLAESSAPVNGSSSISLNRTNSSGPGADNEKCSGFEYKTMRFDSRRHRPKPSGSKPRGYSSVECQGAKGVSNIAGPEALEVLKLQEPDGSGYVIFDGIDRDDKSLYNMVVIGDTWNDYCHLEPCKATLDSGSAGSHSNDAISSIFSLASSATNSGLMCGAPISNSRKQDDPATLIRCATCCCVWHPACLRPPLSSIPFSLFACSPFCAGVVRARLAAKESRDFADVR